MLVGSIHLFVRLREAARHALVFGIRLVGKCLLRGFEVLLVEVGELAVSTALAQVAPVEVRHVCRRLPGLSGCHVYAGEVADGIGCLVRACDVVDSIGCLVHGLVHRLVLGFRGFLFYLLFHRVFGFLENVAKLCLGGCGKGESQHHGGCCCYDSVQFYHDSIMPPC